MKNSIHALIGSNRKKSLTKSMFVSSASFERDFANTHIEVEAYDDTFLNAERKGADYILERVLRELNKTEVIEAIENYLDQQINNVRVIYYSDREGKQETAFIQKNGKFMWQSEAYGY